MVTFHNIFYGHTVVKFPHFLVTQTDSRSETYFQRQTRAYTDNDSLKIKCTISPKVNAFKNSFFYRSHIFWNTLPLEIRSISNPESYKLKLEQHFWLIAENNLPSE